MKNKDQKIKYGKHKGKLVSWIVDNDYIYAMGLAKTLSSPKKIRRAAQSFIDKKLNSKITKTL